MKTVFPTQEVAHIWAKQSQEEGRNAGRNIFFTGKDIYSYGYHFCMGRIIDTGTVLLTDRRYSNTTAKHLSHVRYSVNHFENKIYIPYPEKRLSDNARIIIDRIKTELDILRNSRKRPATKESAKNELASIVHNVTRYTEVTKQPIDKDKTWGMYKDLRKEFLIYWDAAKNSGELDLNKALASLESSRKRAETIKNKKAQKAREESLELWLAGDNSYTVRSNIYGLDKVYLRQSIDVDTPTQKEIKVIETTKGATVSLREGKILFDMIKAGKEVIGHNIGGYTVIRLNGVLKIGCHEIERSEIERFAKTQNWV